MEKVEKDILKYLVKKELKDLKEDEEEVIRPSLGFLKISDNYEEVLKKLLKKL